MPIEKRAQLERRVMPTDEDIAAKLEEREDGQSSLITGYTAVFGVDTTIETFFGSFKERIQKGAFRRAIREGQDVRALRNHEPDNLLGRTAAKTLRLKEDDRGLFIEVDPPNTTVGRDTVESIRRGDLSGMSFAFVVRKEKWINGEDGAPDVRIVQDVDLYDVGPVTYPAYAQTSADVRSASMAYRVGLAEMGKPVPVISGDTEASTEEDSSENEGKTAEETRAEETSDETQVEETREEIAVDPSLAVASFRRRLALSKVEAETERERIKLLPK